MLKVFVLHKNGKPLMPCQPVIARLLLKSKKAKVLQRTPFTIQLLHETTEYVQPVTLGVDAGSKIVGVCATTEKEELYVTEALLRDDISGLIKDRAMYRRNRRYRKTRYRQARFSNRKNRLGKLAPSVQHKVDSHIKIVREVHKILPISKIIVETASFDVQKLKNPTIKGKQYQEGEQLGFYNVKEYVKFRDSYTCKHCKGKSKDKKLHVHHITYRSNGGSDAPSNLITLCETCHGQVHSGVINVQFPKQQSYKDATFMGIMRGEVMETLCTMYKNVYETFGYVTKFTREQLGMEKSHVNDAFCITGNLQAARSNTMYLQKFVRKSNRQLHKANPSKGGIRKANKAPYIVKGFRLFDKVKYEGIVCFIFGRRTTGYFDLRTLSGEVIHRSASWKKLELLETAQTLLKEERIPLLPTAMQLRKESPALF